MFSMSKIFIPGSTNQLEMLLSFTKLTNKKILVLGAFSEFIVNSLNKTNNNVELIVEDYDSLINSKLLLENQNVSTRLMDYEVTDFSKSEFDLIYAQASISDFRRNKIVKEIKRILKPNGIFCVGEITKKENIVPKFVEDIFETSNINPLNTNEIAGYYEKRNFKVIAHKDFSTSLSEYYKLGKLKLEDVLGNLSERERSYHKKLISKIRHHSNAYLKMGGDKFIGFEVLILEKNN
jgi:SAM-dependent methyltransferase